MQSSIKSKFSVFINITILAVVISTASTIAQQFLGSGTSGISIWFFAQIAANIAAIVGVVMAGKFMTNKVVRPLEKITKRLRGADLNLKFNFKTNDEIGQLARFIENFTENIRETLNHVINTAHTVGDSTSEVSKSTDHLAKSSRNQSAHASELAVAVEQMARTSISTAANATQAAKAAAQNGRVARDGGRVVEETVSSIRQIAEVVQNSTITVQGLGQSSSEIGEIVSVIEDIADQTNLLALNAAIEAARAGEQGRGFAVVADEVRKLAERTTEATEKISEMIQNIQAETQDAVTAMRRGNDTVSKGIGLADEAGRALNEIVSSAQVIGEYINQIATASDEQSITTEEIAKSIESISSASSHSADSASQIALAINDLNNMTNDLQQLLTRFSVGESAKGNQYHREKREAKLVEADVDVEKEFEFDL